MVASRLVFTVNQMAVAAKLLQKQNSQSTKWLQQLTKDSTKQPWQQPQRAYVQQHNNHGNAATEMAQQLQMQMSTDHNNAATVTALQEQLTMATK